MFFISHRGNIEGPNPNEENKVEYICEAINQNYDVEVDVWFKNNQFFLGHDEPQYIIDMEFLNNNKLWLHAKNLDCFYKLGETDFNFFWHEEDKVTFTSKGYYWNYPGTKLSKNSIFVLPEKTNFKKPECLGICSDYIKDYYDRYNYI